ncbi:GNAT family N-acetyltransferase [Actinokineospora bangkokensis]|uniref:N-acetyltransferase domain-containing protein n=1 Tax=Actinokineospora bangkokensis TaxID=1193682 RepID=A0A1Q9LEY0_9PSEU|nr:GNAT family protein [Actinokineospora bangkokensis]OLR90570.1 hypothetical protein BJP25_28525 [Actinokineospora bangkokensis]
MRREPLRARDGLALVVPGPADEAATAGRHDDDPFDVDPDDRPNPPPASLTRATVLDERTGAPLGQVSWHQVGWGRTRACAAWNVGIALLPAARGRGAGALALRLVAEHLFATTDLDRVEAATDVDNRAARGALERAGFRFEGTARGAQLRGGVRRDMALYGLLRDDD